MKKLLALFLSLAIVLTLVGCGDNHTPSTDPTDAPTIPTTDPSTAVTDAPTDPPHFHEYQISDTIGASCTENGYTVYACSCGDTYQADETEALGHRYGEWVTVKESTEAEEGQAQRTCTVCGEAETRALAKLIPNHTHSYTEEVTKKATCSAEGIKTYTCSCGDTYTENIARAAHKYKDSITAATCTAGGYTTHTCNLCGYSYVDGKTDSTGHKWGKWVTTKEPTTTSTGTAERTCSNCGTKETKTLDKLIENHTHSYTETVTKAAACTEDGVKTFTCSCGSSYTENVTKLGHSYTSQVTEPTCTAGGYTTHTCSRCSNSYKDSATSAKGHSYTSKTTTAATCTTDGVKTYTCSTCSNTYTEAIAKLGHNYNSIVTKPTCTTDGYTTHTCSRCNNSYKDSTVSATGHVNTTTVTEGGYKTVTCNDCGVVISKTAVSTGHTCTWVTKNLAEAAKADVAAGYYDFAQYTTYTDWNVQVCSGCGLIDEDTIEFAYSDYQAASIMLGYVNELRASVGVSALELDTTLIELAKIRAKEASVNFSHYIGATYTNASENLHHGKYNIYDQYVSWYNSSGHYQNMISSNHVYFGYAMYRTDTGAPYGAQLFWSASDRLIYLDSVG